MRIVDACREAGISPRTYYDRRAQGLSHEQALAAPKKAGVPWSKRVIPAVGINALLRRWRTC